MTERESASQDRVKVEVGPAPVDCYLNDTFMERIEGVGVRVIFDGKVVWEKREYPKFLSSVLGYMPKPFYETRIKRARKKADGIAGQLITSVQTS